MIKQEVRELADINIMKPEEVKFHVSPNGFIGLEYLDKSYKRVTLSRILPLNDPDRYISVSDMENKEIGIIRAVEELAPEQAVIVREELSKRYYCPEILKITSVKEKMGYLYFDVETKDRSRNFALKDAGKNIRQLDERRIMIFDVDGNRYIIQDINLMDAKSMRRIEPYLF